MSPQETFESVLAAARVGAEWAWVRLYAGVGPSLRGYIVRQGSVDADDLVGETWLHVARSLCRFEGDEAAFRSWVFTIAHHRVIDERRKRRRKPYEALDEAVAAMLPADRGQSAEDEVLTHQSHADALAALDQLSPDQREVLLLRLLSGFSLNETARIMGKSPGAVNSLQRRALNRLERKFGRSRTLSLPPSVTEVQ